MNTTKKDVKPGPRGEHDGTARRRATYRCTGPAGAAFASSSLAASQLVPRDFPEALARRAGDASVQLVGDQRVKPYHCVLDYHGNFVLEMKSPRA